jgi:hypothetical protein
VSKLTAVVPGYATVARASEVLHLAPRSVRDLIYAGRLLSVRMGRRHYIRAADLEAERRRRLGLPRARRAPRPRLAGPRAMRTRIDPAVRAQRAAERRDARAHWAQTHPAAESELPFRVLTGRETAVCASCGAALAPGTRQVERAATASQPATILCVRCARRALLAWADARHDEAFSARRLARALGARDGGEPTMRAA